MKIGYIRVSTTDQNTARQEVLMAELGVEKVFIDRISGKNTDRPELKEMMGFVRNGDTVISKVFHGLHETQKTCWNWWSC